jgi:hypothetical protein
LKSTRWMPRGTAPVKRCAASQKVCTVASRGESGREGRDRVKGAEAEELGVVVLQAATFSTCRCFVVIPAARTGKGTTPFLCTLLPVARLLDPRLLVRRGGSACQIRDPFGPDAMAAFLA